MLKSKIVELADKYLVKDWRDGWKWATTWFFGILVFLATVPIPEEVLRVFTPDHQEKILGYIAVIGVFVRFVKQTKKE